jgi:putative tricarboxylic transport membrane protein
VAGTGLINLGVAMTSVARFPTLSVVMLALICCSIARAEDRVHFLIPGGAGGGWDMTARAVGESMSRSDLIKVASYENLSGGGGSRAIAHLVENAPRQANTLMVSSTSIILRSLRDNFQFTYRDLTPIASVIADYGAFVVRVDSPYQSWQDVIDDYRKDYRRVNIAGGSSRGSTDHVVAALAFAKSGLDVRRLKYIPYNAGGHAMVGLLSGETQLLSTGLSEGAALAEQGEVRILAITAPERLPLFPEVPTLAEQGVPAIFANWRGFLAAPGLDPRLVRDYELLLEKMLATELWQELRNSRGWSHLHVSGDDFENFLAEQERELSVLLADLGLLVKK